MALLCSSRRWSCSCKRGSRNCVWPLRDQVASGAWKATRPQSKHSRPARRARLCPSADRPPQSSQPPSPVFTGLLKAKCGWGEGKDHPHSRKREGFLFSSYSLPVPETLPMALRFSHRPSHNPLTRVTPANGAEPLAWAPLLPQLPPAGGEGALKATRFAWRRPIQTRPLSLHPPPLPMPLSAGSQPGSLRAGTGSHPPASVWCFITQGEGEEGSRSLWAERRRSCPLLPGPLSSAQRVTEKLPSRRSHSLLRF